MKNVAIKLFTVLTAIFVVSNPVLAANIENGERIFTANCAACHAGGNNVIMPEKTLKKDALETNGMKSVSAITYQVTNGKNAMPAFGGRLSDTDIEDVANYVLSQSDKGWD
jgi:cytochrome c6